MFVTSVLKKFLYTLLIYFLTLCSTQLLELDLRVLKWLGELEVLMNLNLKLLETTTTRAWVLIDFHPSFLFLGLSKLWCLNLINNLEILILI